MEDRDARDLNEISSAISYLKQARDVLHYDTRNKGLCSDITVAITRAAASYSRLAAKLR